MKKIKEKIKDVSKTTKDLGNKVDKTTKQAKGLGDSIETFTEKTGIKSLVNTVLGDDCGCNERRDWLNKMFPYKAKDRLDCDEYEYLSETLPLIKNSITSGASEKLLKIYQKYVNSKQKHTNCSSCWVGIIKVLRGMVAQYDEDVRIGKEKDENIR